jgi:hypothetical protein
LIKPVRKTAHKTVSVQRVLAAVQSSRTRSLQDYLFSRHRLDPSTQKRRHVMAKKFIEAAGTIGLLCIILLLGSGLGCSRSDAPQSQQTSTPAASAPVAQAPAPVQAPPAPVTSMPASPAPPAAPPYTAPSQPPAMQPPVAGPQNFTQIQLGMTSAQVRQLMGEPGRVKQKDNKVEWEYYSPQGKYEVELVNDRVAKIETH